MLVRRNELEVHVVRALRRDDLVVRDPAVRLRDRELRVALQRHHDRVLQRQTDERLLVDADEIRVRDRRHRRRQLGAEIRHRRQDRRDSAAAADPRRGCSIRAPAGCSTHRSRRRCCAPLRRVVVVVGCVASRASSNRAASSSARLCGGRPTVVVCGAAPGVVTGCGSPCSWPGADVAADRGSGAVVDCGVAPGCELPDCVVPGCGAALDCISGTIVGCVVGAGLACAAAARGRGRRRGGLRLRRGDAAEQRRRDERCAQHERDRTREQHRFLLDLDRRFDRHPDAQRLVGRRVVDDDAHRDALRDLHEVARRVLRRHEAERVLRSRCDRRRRGRGTSSLCRRRPRCRPAVRCARCRAASPCSSP